MPAAARAGLFQRDPASTPRRSRDEYPQIDLPVRGPQRSRVRRILAIQRDGLPQIRDYPIAVEAEDLGYDAMWFGDSQLFCSDCYPTMALAAQATTRIRLGTGVSVPGTRVAPVTAR